MILLDDEEIYNLREQGLSYKEIEWYLLEKKGIVVSKTTILKKCKKIYAEKGKEEPKETGKLNKIPIPDEEIFNLREKGLSYESIAIYFRNKGIEVSFQTIKNRCEEIYTKKGKEIPKLSNKTKIIDDEELFNLREMGLSYEEIKKYYYTKGIEVSRQRIFQKCKKIYAEKGKEEPKGKIIVNRMKIPDEELAKAIFDLIKSKNATIEQIQIIAKYYGIDLNRTINSLDEQER